MVLVLKLVINDSQTFANQSVRASNVTHYPTKDNLNRSFHVSPPRIERSAIEINEQVRYKVRKATQNVETAQDTFMQLKIAKSGLNSAKKIISDLKQIASQAMNSSTADGDRATLQTQLSEVLPEEFSRIINGTTYHQNKLLDGSFQAHFNLGSLGNRDIKIKINDMGAVALGIDSLSVMTKAGATHAFQKLDKAFEKIDSEIQKIHATDVRIRSMLAKKTNLVESILDENQLIRRSTDTKQLLNTLTKQLLDPSNQVIDAKSLHKTNNHTVLQIFADALDMTHQSQTKKHP